MRHEPGDDLSRSGGWHYELVGLTRVCVRWNVSCCTYFKMLR